MWQLGEVLLRCPFKKGLRENSIAVSSVVSCKVLQDLLLLLMGGHDLLGQPLLSLEQDDGTKLGRFYPLQYLL